MDRKPIRQHLQTIYSLLANSIQLTSNLYITVLSATYSLKKEHNVSTIIHRKHKTEKEKNTERKPAKLRKHRKKHRKRVFIFS